MEKDKKKKDKNKKRDDNDVTELMRGREIDSRDMDFSNTVEEIRLGSKKQDKKKRMKREEEVMEDSVTIKGGSHVGWKCEKIKGGEKKKQNVKLESIKDEKKKRKRKKLNNDKDSSSNVLVGGLNGGINKDKRDEEVGKYNRAQRGESSNSEEAEEENIELQINESIKRKKERMDSVGSHVEPFETEFQEKLSDDQRRIVGNNEEFRVEKRRIHEGQSERPQDVQMEEKKEKNKNIKNIESLLKDALAKEKFNRGNLIRKDNDGCERSVDSKKIRKKFENNSFESENNENHKRKRAKKDEEVRNVKPLLNEIPNGVLGAGEKLTTKDTETAEDIIDKMQSSTMRREKKKNRREKEKKDSPTEDVLLSSEGISNTEMNGKTNIKSNARRITAKKTNKGKSDVLLSSEGISNTEMNGKTNIKSNARRITAKKTNKGKEEYVNHSTISQAEKTSKRVTFSDRIEVFPSSAVKDNENESKDNCEEGSLLGKRFSKEEDEIIKEAVYNYIEKNHLGEEGLQMVLKCSSYPQTRGCWKEIGAALPQRRRYSVYDRAHVLFERSEQRKWEPEEYEMLQSYYKEYGSQWKIMADLLGKHRKHVQDAWRRTRLPNARIGAWSQKEYQSLFDLVNLDLRMKAFEEKRRKCCMLKESISWQAISEKLSTRTHAICCQKWYNQLASPLVARGLWADSDDYRLLDALQKLDASCKEGVDWDNLLEHRSGEVCRKRWDQMTKHIGGYRERTFMEQVELLSTRYCLDMLEYRTGGVKEL